MVNQKLFWKDNLRFLRERKKMTQDTLANALEITRSKLNALENGQTKNPPMEDMIRCSDFFKISVDSLIKIDLSKLGELKLRELEAGNDVYMTGSKLRVLAITVDKNNRENLEYVPIKAKAGYRAGYNDPEYIAKLPRFTLPNLPKNGTMRMFSTTGDSMLPFPENSDIIAQYVEDWKAIKPGTPCIVILKGDQDFVFKLVSVLENGKVLLKSLNTAYEPYTVNSDEIIEIWKFHKFQTDRLPEAQTDLQELKAMILSLEKRLM